MRHDRHLLPRRAVREALTNAVRREMRAFNGTEPELRQDDGNPFVRVTFRLDPQGEAFTRAR